MTTDTPKDDWQANAGIEVLRVRAAVYEKIREFFKQRQVLEVDTPVLSRASTPDPNIDSFESRNLPAQKTAAEDVRYLSTSPEFHMKRLLASGSGAIYQLSHVFRQGECGHQHNPEFTMLEWYRPELDYHGLMQEVAELVDYLLDKTIDIEKLSYQDAFCRYLGVDPLSVSTSELQDWAQNCGLVVPDDESIDKDFYLDFLMSHKVQPQLGKNRLSFVYEYPATQCAYARISSADNRVAERFELFYQGIELANGYQELLDADEQLRRFEQQNDRRQMLGQQPVRYDVKLLAALKQGMPACSGVALGVDRLIQQMLNVKNIADVLAFPFNRA